MKIFFVYIPTMSTRVRLIIALILKLAVRNPLHAQRIAITSNALEDVVLTPNVGVEIVVADRLSLSFDTSFSPYKIATSSTTSA